MSATPFTLESRLPKKEAEKAPRTGDAVKHITVCTPMKRGDVFVTKRGGSTADMKNALRWIERHAARLAKMPTTETGGELIHKIRAGKVKA